MPNTYNGSVDSLNDVEPIKSESPLIELIHPGKIEADIQGIISDLKPSEIDRISNYSNNLLPRLAVGWALINNLKLQDSLTNSGNALARHRFPEIEVKGKIVKVEPSYIYPVHALLVVDGIEIGVMIRDLLNQLLEQRRPQFPLEQGYRVVLAVGQGDRRGDYPNLTLGDSKHPWMLAKENAGNPVVTKFSKGVKAGRIDLDKTWARICIVDNLAKEGIDNPLCGVIGFAATCNSQQEAVQRIGRVLRSYIDDSQVQSSGLLLVPPKSLDEIKIFLHSQLTQEGKTLKSIVAAIDYMINMRLRLEQLTTIDDLIDNQGGNSAGEMNTPDALNTAERLAIAYDLGEYIIASPKISREEAIELGRDNILRTRINNNPKKKDKANDWIAQIKQNPEAASSQLHLIGTITTQDIIRHESRDLKEENITNEQLVNWLKAHKPDQLGMVKYLHHPEFRKYLAADYAETYRLLESLPTKNKNEMQQDLDNAREALLKLVWYKIKDPDGNLYYSLNQIDPKKLAGIIKKRLNTAIKIKLIGYNNKEASVSKKSRYIQPQYVAVLRLENVQRELVGYTVRSILSEYCPQLKASMNWCYVQDENDEIETIELDYGEAPAQN
ncbi:hypothetical protein QUB70_09285 [Microcoleus sp. A003_D6]|uniref:hypothetical protein n=1 Tax=Microcoleus sp. A003_D6 TaxID=3055266 RepID=UPI002FCFEE60